jgi:hypothetical protein
MVSSSRSQVVVREPATALCSLTVRIILSDRRMLIGIAARQRCHTCPMAVEWIGETTLVLSNLGSAPLFGPSGESPPLRTEPVVVSWALTDPDGSLITLPEQAIASRLGDQALIARSITGECMSPESAKSASPRYAPLQLFLYLKSIRRIVYRQYWKREDPVVQLVPGETQIYSVQLNSGLTDQVLREFSSSLGLGGKVSAVELSAQLSGRLSRTVTISTELQTAMTKQLANSRNKYMRRVAVWHVVHSVVLYRIAYLNEDRLPVPGERFEWKEFQHIEFADKGSPQSTYFDVPAR